MGVTQKLAEVVGTPPAGGSVTSLLAEVVSTPPDFATLSQLVAEVVATPPTFAAVSLIFIEVIFELAPSGAGGVWPQERNRLMRQIQGQRFARRRGQL